MDVSDKVHGGAELLLPQVAIAVTAASRVVLGGLEHHDRLFVDTQPDLEEAEDVTAALGQRGKVGVEVGVARVAGLKERERGQERSRASGQGSNRSSSQSNNRIINRPFNAMR